MLSHFHAVRDILSDTMGQIEKDYPYTALQQFAIAVIIFFPALSTIIVALRIHTRLKFKSFGSGQLRGSLAVQASRD
jgi:hypothetical protein